MVESVGGERCCGLLAFVLFVGDWYLRFVVTCLSFVGVLCGSLFGG